MRQPLHSKSNEKILIMETYNEISCEYPAGLVFFLRFINKLNLVANFSYMYIVKTPLAVN